MLRAGTEPNVFYTYFTDLPQVLVAGQAADITPYVNSKTVPALKDIVPTAMKAVTAGKTLYGLPTSNYTQGLIFNRKLFKQAGLNPDKPPTTWAEVEQDAKAIAKLGNGIDGLRRLQRGQQRRLALLLLHRRRGRPDDQHRPAPRRPSTPTRAQAVLQALHKMRFIDHAMSPTQGLAWGTLQQQIAAGKLGMYIAAPDDIYNVIVPTDRATSTTSAWARCPA